MYALVDCNNFYASCERAFNPALEGKPIIVLSNNDGCVIARSDEAKMFGIGMAEPYYKVKRLCKKHRIQVFSSNYSLYGDMSQRVMTSIEMLCPDLEIYSVDEAFLSLAQFSHLSPIGFASQIRHLVKQWTGIPTSVGIGQTKTLAKVANHIAKKHMLSGVFDLSYAESQRFWLARFPVEEVWGIGRAWSKKLKQIGINTAHDLRYANPQMIRQQFGVTMLRTQQELNSLPCLDIEESVPRKNILSSKSFGSPQTDFETIAQALASHAARACEKLRKQGSHANSISVFLHTNSFSKNEKQYHNSASYTFDTATSDTSVVVTHAKNCLRRIFKKGYRYQKTGIVLSDLSATNIQQQSLWGNKTTNQRSQKLMSALDNINQHFGSNRLFLAAQGTKHKWRNRSDHRSPRYTTQWQELPKVE